MNLISLVLITLTTAISIGNTIAAVDVIFQYKQNANLTCSLNGDNIKFYKQEANSTKVELNEKSESYSIKENTLKLNDLRRPSIEAKYSCQLGESIVEFNNLIAPYVSKPNRTSLTITEGGRAEFACGLLYGNENGESVTWKWMNNNTELTPSDRIKIESTDEKSTLIVEDLTIDDKGFYQCHLVNSHGEHFEQIQLRVKDKFAVLWPFLAICAEVAILCSIILIYEKKCGKKQKEDDSEQAQTLMGNRENQSTDLKKRNTKA